jgi:mRNA interferase MazF
VVTPAAGEVVLVPFPFSDMSRSKVRPAVCLADAGRGDWVLCQITSKPYGDPMAMPLDAPDFASGGLMVASFARPGKLFTAHVGVILRSVGVLNPSAFARAMKAALEDLVRRRPVWEALSDLFLDTELTESFYRFIARRIIESGYTPAEVHSILWGEVFPVIEFNLRHPAGVWEGFRGDWLQEQILDSGKKQTAAQQPGTARIVSEAWIEVCLYLPVEFRQ